MNLAVRTVPLNKRERVVFDVRRNVYRVVYYRTKGNQEERIAAEHPKLGMALQIVFGEACEPDCQHDADTVEHYIRSTAWGKRLP